MERIKNIFGQRLVEVRTESNLTQTQLAQEFGVSQTCIGKWEKGTRNPSLDDLIMVAKYFNVTTDYLLGLTDF